jgi:hypothetical protein
MAPDDDPPRDPTVKDLLAKQASLDDVVDLATRRELERWFGLPSADALDAAKIELPKDPELESALMRRRVAIENVDRALLAAIEDRVADRSDRLIQFKPNLELRIDPDTAFFDAAMIEKLAVVADPREVERPEDLADEMKSSAPQALLRDLHRPVTDFTLTFEHVDIAAEQRLDIVAEVKAAMSTSWKLPPLGRSPWLESRELLEAARILRKQSWPALWDSMTLANRRAES